MNSTSTFASQSLPAFAPFESHTPAFPTAVHSSAPVPFYSSAPSPRSRTYSTTSSVSSFRSSYLDEASPDNSACTSHPSYDQSLAMNLLLDGNGQGFVVEDSNTGRVLVHWDQLIQFLVNRELLSLLTRRNGEQLTQNTSIVHSSNRFVLSSGSSDRSSWCFPRL
jgi:hypothetical protein